MKFAMTDFAILAMEYVGQIAAITNSKDPDQGHVTEPIR
jgi:hypothetical protein